MKERIKESQDIEFKSSWRDEYLRIICAFANTEGGKLVIGVDDEGNLLGVQNAKRLLEDIPNKTRNKLGIIPSIELKTTDGKEIIYVYMTHSSVPISYDGKYYVRSGSTTLELQGNVLANFIMKKMGKTWDEFIEDRANLEEINLETIAEFRRLAADRIPSIVKEKEARVILEKLGLMEGEHLKRAAVLLFGKNTRRFYLQAKVKIGRFLTNTQILTTDIIEGNLFEQLENTLEVLRTKYLVSNIKFEGIHRRDILEYPYEALREAIINALIHRDYLGTSAIQIRVYNDRLVIMNEGKLPPEVPVEKLKTDHLSMPRNTLLAEVFYFAGLIESWGRGTIKIVENCIKQGLPEPNFVEEYGVMKVEFYKDKWTEEYLRELGLNERQIKAVMYVKEKKKITNKEYQKLANAIKKTTSRDLISLVEKEIFEQVGTTGKGTYYILKGTKGT